MRRREALGMAKEITPIKSLTPKVDYIKGDMAKRKPGRPKKMER
jgi:hypothetical protein